MRALQIVCILLVVLILTTQSVRHFYVKYCESTSSLLHKYDKEKDALRRQIEAAKSAEELDALYAPARKATDALDAEMEDGKKKLAKEEDRSEFERLFRKQHEKEYDRESMLRESISDWENRSEQIRELRVFWAFGLGLFVVGCLVYLRSQWLGMSFVIAGAVEMIWWTSPSFRFAGSPLEFERLLTNKLLFTNLTLLVVLAAWVLLGMLRRRRTGA